MTDEERFIFDNMTWSFSRLNSFDHCKYAWHRKYIDCEEDESSAMAEYGTLMHKILELFASKQLSIFELPGYFEEMYDQAIPHDFPPNKYVDLRKSYFDKGMDYLNNLALDFGDNEILGIEKKVEFELFDHKMIGFIDLLLRNKEDGSITIMDHKSANLKILKSGAISKTDAAHFAEFKKQLYVYSYPILKEFGRVDYLSWNLFKEQKILTIPWEESEYKESLKWVGDTLEKIKNEDFWFPNNANQFYCKYLCGYRNDCDFNMETGTGNIFLHDEKPKNGVGAPSISSPQSVPRKQVPFICPQCNGNSYTIKNGIVVCDYCGTMFTEDLEEIIDGSFKGILANE